MPIKMLDRWSEQSRASSRFQHIGPFEGRHSLASSEPVQGSMIEARIAPGTHVRNESRKIASSTVNNTLVILERGTTYLRLQKHAFEQHQSLPLERMNKLSQAQSKHLIAFVFVVRSILSQALLETL